MLSLVYLLVQRWSNIWHEFKQSSVFGKNIVDGSEVALSYALLGALQH